MKHYTSKELLEAAKQDIDRQMVIIAVGTLGGGLIGLAITFLVRWLLA